ncbi:MAG: hypothetical protein O3A95_07990 [Planctomycetota bacterium]|nr:hypothetical protein [Planctomycetota bacterium]MDA1114222.1 hypothetical protein [Planctomycetota bacterium]
MILDRMAGMVVSGLFVVVPMLARRHEGIASTLTSNGARDSIVIIKGQMERHESHLDHHSEQQAHQKEPVIPHAPVVVIPHGSSKDSLNTVLQANRA